MNAKDKVWVAALDGAQVIAVQHGCGAGDGPVNCFIDEQRNWQCPNCMAIYGAAMPLAEWGALSAAPSDTGMQADSEQESFRSGDFYVFKLESGEAVEHRHHRTATVRSVLCVWEHDPHSVPPRYRWRCPECNEIADNPIRLTVKA